MPEKTHHSVLSDAEILSHFREWQARQSDRPTFVPLQNHPAHRGVMDANYVRPPASEFPKMAYRKSASAPNGHVTKVVASQEEQDALPKGWLTAIEDIHALLESLLPAPAAEEVSADEVQPAKKEKPAKKVK